VRRRPGSPPRLVPGAAAVAAALALGACAASQPRSIADRFVRPATGEVETIELLPRVDDTAAEGAEAAAPPAEAAALPPGVVPGVPVDKPWTGPTIEGQDARLAAALAAFDAAPSAGAAVRVSAEYRRVGVLDAAFDHVEAALEREPRHPALLDARARIWRDWALPQFGLADATRAVYFAPDWPAAHNTLGTLLYALGQPDEARRSFEAARSLDPGAAYVLNNLCYLELMGGRATEALALCDAALAIDPALTPARNNSALIRAAEGRLDEARSAFEDAGGAAAAHFNMGLVHLSRREYALAVREFDAADEALPESAHVFRQAHEARRLLALHRARRGGLQPARENER
jgi:tetratricopeptide (TPR) repeat protein